MRRQLAFLILGCVGLVFFLMLPVQADNIDVSVTVNSPECGDEIDNDGDTFTDFPNDIGCSSLIDNDETNEVPECNDGIDNDGNGNIDFPADLGCDSALDEIEATLSGGNHSENYESLVTFSGKAYPNGTLTILKNGTPISNYSVNKSGVFSFSFGATAGVHTFTLIAYDFQGRSRALSYTLNLIQNSSTEITGIQFPTINIFEIPNLDEKDKICSSRGDLNIDCKVNLFDFSIAAFWWEKKLSPSFSLIESTMLNSDGKIDIYDFSILAYYWTG